MALVVELLVLELVHHCCVARSLFPAITYEPLVGHRIVELGEDGEKSLGHYPATPTAASDYERGPLEQHMVAMCSAAFGERSGIRPRDVHSLTPLTATTQPIEKTVYCKQDVRTHRPHRPCLRCALGLPRCGHTPFCPCLL